MSAEDAPSRHQCRIYDGPPSRSLPAVATCIRKQLAARVRCMYLNSPAMVAGLRSQLYATGVNVESELERGALVLASDNSHLVDGAFVIDRMIETLQAAVVQALADGHAGLFATGDMTWEFGPEKDFAKLLEYEWQLEQLFRRQPALAGICQYHCDLLPHEAVREGLVSHSRVFINETLTRLNPLYVGGRSTERKTAAARPEVDRALEHLLALATKV